MSTTQKPLLDLEQGAAHLSITPRHLRQLWQAHALAGVRVGRLVRFDVDDLNAYIDRQRIDATQSVVAPDRRTRPPKALTAKKAVKSGGATK